MEVRQPYTVNDQCRDTPMGSGVSVVNMQVAYIPEGNGWRKEIRCQYYGGGGKCCLYCSKK